VRPLTTGGAGRGGCGLVPASVVDGTYGASVTGPTAQTKGPVTVCTYFSSSPVLSVLLRFEVNETVAMFKAGRKSFSAHEEPTVTVPGLAQMAYSSVFGSGKTLTSTVVVLSRQTELLVTGTGPLSIALALPWVTPCPPDRRPLRATLVVAVGVCTSHHRPERFCFPALPALGAAGRSV
jgi:hypothetical protein